MIGFWAFVDPAADEATLTPAPDELVEARWWARDELAHAAPSARRDHPAAARHASATT